MEQKDCHGRKRVRCHGYDGLAKRQQVNLDNIIMIGVNCGGTVSPYSQGR